MNWEPTAEEYLRKLKFNGWSKYTPHCGKQQQRRYLRQVRAGQLAGRVWSRKHQSFEPYVTAGARYTAHGIIAP